MGVPSKGQTEVGSLPLSSQGRPRFGEPPQAPRTHDYCDPMLRPNPPGPMSEGPLLVVEKAHGADGSPNLLQGNPQLWAVAGDLFIKHFFPRGWRSL